MRVCLVKIGGSVEWDDKTRDFKKGLTSISQKYDMFLRTIIGNTRNWTITTRDTNEESLEAIQANKTDIIVATVHFPLHPSLTNVRQSQVEGEYNMAITSFYDSNVERGEDVDLLDTFKSFEPEIWVMVLTMLLTIGALMVVSVVLKSSFMMRLTKKRISFPSRGSVLRATLIRDRKKHRNKMIVKNFRETFDMLWMGLLDQDGSLSDPSTRRKQPWSRAILRVSLCFFLFWTSFYLRSMIKTELVTVRSPKTINNYQDILDKKDMKPFFLSSATDYLTFMHADKHSLEGKLWTRIISQTGGYNHSLITGTSFIGEVFQMIPLRKVMIASRERLFAVRSLCCKVKSVFQRKLGKKEWMSLRTWTSGDSTAKPVLRGFATNVAFDDREVRNRLRSQFEHGFEKHINRAVELDILSTVHMLGHVDKAPLDEKQKCMGNTVEKESPQVHQPCLVNFRKLFFNQFFLGMSIAFSILLLEFAFSSFKKTVKQNRWKCY